MGVGMNLEGRIEVYGWIDGCLVGEQFFGVNLGAER